RAVGARLVLDFLNTADWSEEGEVIDEKLASLADVMRWTDALGISRAITDGRAHDLTALRHLRAELRELCLSVLRGSPPDPEVIGQLNELLNSTADASQIVRFTRRPWLVVESRLIDAILTSAKAVLTDPREIGRINMCQGTDCGWFYLDESRNQQRKWCMMQTCGNRAKARRFYANKTSQAVTQNSDSGR
ncbi:MAG: CGNR zinc finger domain-containing protein, partial [Pseudomonadota bacterium]